MLHWGRSPNADIPYTTFRCGNIWKILFYDRRIYRNMAVGSRGWSADRVAKNRVVLWAVLLGGFETIFSCIADWPVPLRRLHHGVSNKWRQVQNKMVTSRIAGCCCDSKWRIIVTWHWSLCSSLVLSVVYALHQRYKHKQVAHRVI